MDPQAEIPPMQTTSLAVPEDMKAGGTHVDRLPAEVWLQIFTLGKRLHDTRLFGSNVAESHRIDSTISISQTCSSFRQLVMSSPMLWTTIYIDDKSSASDILHRINRSRPLTLDIAMYLANGDEEDSEVPASLNQNIVDTLMDLIVGEIGRWRSFRIRLEKEQADRPIIMRLRDHGAPTLEYLSISVRAKEPGAMPPAPHILNHGAPRLISTKLRGVAHVFYRPPLVDITILRLEGIGHLRVNFTTFVGIITQPPRLRHLMIRKDIVSPDVWALQSPGSLRLQSMQSLHIYSESGVMYAGLLLAMDAPRLSALTLEGVFDHDLDLLWNRADPKKFEKLSHLTLLTETDMSSTTYFKACRLLPNITDCAIQRVTTSNSSLFTVLNREHSKTSGDKFMAWPMLHTLQLAMDSSADSMEKVRQLVDARKAANCRLGQVCFFNSERYAWMSADEWSLDLDVTVRVVHYDEVLPGDMDYIDIDDVAV